MTFEEWYAMEYGNIDLTPLEKDRLERAWDAGNNEGYKDGCEEVMSK